jgi:type I restriction enzyme S subunit
MSIFDGLLGISQWNGIVTYHYLVFRPSPDIDARYYGYLLRSTLYLHDFAKRVRGLGDAQQSNVRTPHIRIGDVGQTIVPFPVRHEQTAIADYLDDETTRIDGLIAKKRRMISVISTRRSILIEQAIRASVDRCGAMPLKHVAGRIEVGIVVTPSAWYADDGVLALRGMNVRPGELVLDEVVRISEEGHRLHRKSELRSGDVVVVRTGQAGAAAVVPPSLAGANCIDLVIIRSASKLLPEFLHFVLNSDWTQKHIEAHSVGTIQSHFNVGSMKDLPLPVPSLDEQRRVVELLTEASADHDRLMTALEKQISLLAEHRQALITAAVTGELRIPGVAA